MHSKVFEDALRKEFIREAERIEEEVLSGEDEGMPDEVRERIYQKIMSHI